MSETEPGSRVGSRFGPYQLVRLIGRGGMGEVYEAEDTRKNRIVALKLISTQYSENPVFRARMQREADTAGRLTEPHIVPIHDYGEIDGQFYVEMRLIDGVSLRTLLTQYGPLAPARAVAIVRQVAAALDAAHTSGVTHRDVKPENILVAANDFAYLVDFGIARAAHDPGLTQSGMAVGTYNYMAPERFTADDITYRADIYALACVLGECLTGAPPYRTDSVERLIAAHLMEPPPRPSVLRPGRVPPALDEVIAKGMAKNPQERYMSAGDLAIAAHDALTMPEQRQEATILERGDNATLIANAGFGGAWTNYTGAGPQPQPQPQLQPPPPIAPRPRYPTEDETAVRPVPPSLQGWRSKPHTSDQRTQAAPVVTGTGWPSQPGLSPVGPGPAGQGAGSAGLPSFSQPSQPQPTSQPRNKRKTWTVAAVIAAVILVAAGISEFVATRPKGSTPPQGQVVLPFNGLNFRFSPGGVAVDDQGTVYVTNQTMYGRVVTLPAGSSTPTVKPFNGLYEPQGLAVDGSGTIYVSDFNNRVVSLAAGSNRQVELPFSGLNYPEGIAVDAQGGVYVADRGNNRVVKLAAGSTSQTVLPFNGLKNPDGVAVDTDGNVYVTDTDNNRVVKLEAGTSNQSVLPFTGLTAPWGITVDGAGNVYVTEHDNNAVAKLPAGATASTELPFTGLNTPLSVAVDKNGNVYVADRGNGRVLKLAQGS
ncbi:MAG: protein kinase [Mycobacterium pseudokansasii]|uniref:non-specific serine/threonine protein kinase n=1 Tax=Mycobacterium pseudokansasii TaxID=2341080 RepID=A0A498QWC2_9MYCO|nr:serine/threonine-protein kinase PknD [Mycobacterium pseudokansasii]MBY0389290.1 protein kinase [Mycobacterium pseudokansasii]VBA30341.1 Serine/threonine-protein kinase PknD [Mycobacterium pseudokansasii]VBA32035.1 Serine/threonine-protein kinase PknD [Mycobacterium pseudokansasii]VBA54345.1 Serine/threonine-protein kinase PknD [Mycobacterium pseudokansasii]